MGRVEWWSKVVIYFSAILPVFRLIALACLTVACTTTTPLAAGVWPLEDNTAPLPTSATDTFPETLSVVTGAQSAYSWAHGKAYVRAAPADVWRAFQDPEVVVDRHGTDSHTVALNNEPEYAFSFLIHHDKSIVNWDEQWRYGVPDGTFSDPQLALIRYQKVDGTSFITLLEGSITVREVAGEPAVAIVEFINHINAADSDTSTAVRTLNNQYSSVLAKVKGQPLP